MDPSLQGQSSWNTSAWAEPLGQGDFALGILSQPLSVALQVQLPEALHQLFQSLKELLLLFYRSVLLPVWHLLLAVLAQVQEHCHEACR